MTKPSRFAALHASHQKPPPTDVQRVDLEAERRRTALSNFEFRGDEDFFRHAALRVYDHGWMPIPQQKKGKRRPTLYDGRGLKWGAYTEVRADRETVELWANDRDAHQGNVALLLGPPSGNTFALDIDVTDKIVNYDIRDVVERVLGRTMQRTGNPPKTAFFYGVASVEDLPRSSRFVLADADGGPTTQMVEVQGTGHMMTAVGRHHSTSNIFKWSGGSPLDNGPEGATLVTGEQLAELWDEIAKVAPLYTPARSNGIITVDGEVDVEGIRSCHVSAFGSDQWVEKDGLVFDGREAYLWSIVRELTRRNPHTGGDEDVRKLASVVRSTFRQGEHPSKRWFDRELDDEIGDKLRRAGVMLSEGRIRPIESKVVAGKVVALKPIEHIIPKPKVHDHDQFTWLGKRRTQIRIKEGTPDQAKANQRRLRLDRDKVTKEAAQKVRAGIDAFLDDVEAGVGRVHVVAGPTGAGKSTQALLRISARPSLLDRTPIENEDGTTSTPGPLLFVVPTYRNVDELRDKSSMLGLDGDATDEDLMAAAKARGLIHEGDGVDYLQQLRRFAVKSNLRTDVYMGKVTAGCLIADKVKLLQKAHIPTGGICKGRVPIKDEMKRITGFEEKKCEFYDSCPAIAQIKRLPAAHVVFLAKNFLVLNIPEELKHPRGVIIDERFFNLLIETRTMPLKSLSIGRREPSLTKAEKEAGVSPYELLQDHDQAADIAKKALLTGQDVARVLAEFSETTGTHTTTGVQLVANARRVCGSAMTSQADLHPDLTFEEVQDICKRPAGTDIAEEYRFWKIVEEEIAAVLEGRLDSTRAPEWDRDPRIRLLDAGSEEPSISISWKVEPNWRHAPMMLLDASTDDEITRRVLGGGREIIRHDVPVPLNMRLIAAIDKRLSMRSLFPSTDASVDERRKCAELLADIRQIVSTICAIHANGRVMVSMPMKLRRAVLCGWAEPLNADFVHLGAVAGLDFARRHVAILTIGRMELPVRQIDGMVAALSYGDAVPETPIDVHGTGEDEDGKVLYPHTERRVLHLRDGSDTEFTAQEHAGELARRVQRQYREEEARQNFGRGRPVYRTDPLMVYAVTESIPEDVIVDEIVAFDDLANRAGSKMWEAVRLAKGCISARLLAGIADHLSTAADFERLIEKYVIDVPVVRRRYHELKIIYDDGTEEPAFIPAHGGQQHLDILKAMLRHVGLTGNLRWVTRSDQMVEAAEAAKEDKIAGLLGDRWVVEMAETAEIREHLIACGEWRPKPVGAAIYFAHLLKTVPPKYRAGTGDMANVSMSIGAWLALKNFDDEWVLTGDMPTVEDAKGA